jgi:hypothetical protein
VSTARQAGLDEESIEALFSTTLHAADEDEGHKGR